MIPIYCVSGVAYGMVELIRRVIPRDIVGGSVQKLRQVDSIVSPLSSPIHLPPNTPAHRRYTSFTKSPAPPAPLPPAS